ncbi:MAG: hypothetical protein JZD40_03605 [Sulfolobus sp.]|nr:hypothetical protein [Sulfolobus sp.]
MKVIYIKLTDEEYKEIEERARKEGYTLVSEYVRSVLLSQPTPSSGSSINVSDIVTQISSRLERRVQDLLNPFTAQIEDLKKKAAEIIEKIEEIEVKSGKKVSEEEERKEERSFRKVIEQPKKEGERKTAMDILNEQGVTFESELKLRNTDAYFSKLEREGAKIIYTEKERIAMSHEFYENFLNKLREIKTSDLEEASSKLDPKEAKLFRKLASEGLIIYDQQEKYWKPLF